MGGSEYVGVCGGYYYDLTGPWLCWFMATMKINKTGV